jgi:hypothetical protein
MASSKKSSKKINKHNNTIFLLAQSETIITVILLLIIFVGFIGFGIYLLIVYIKKKVENYDSYYTCTMTLNDIDPMNVNQYMKYDNKHIPCGDCKDATLKVVVNTCAVDDDGVQSPNCKPNLNVVSSIPKPIDFSGSDVSFDNINRFFCLD